MALSVDQKRLKATKFPLEFDQRVDIKKVKIDLMKKWISDRITKILGDEDDVVIDTCYNLLEQSQFPNIKEIQIQLTGFLNKECATFCKELWNLMLSAQESPVGVPKEMLEAKKLELQQEQANKAAAESRRRLEQEENDMVDQFRRSERSDRGASGHRGGRGDFGDRGSRRDREDRGRGRGPPFRGDRSDRGRDFDHRAPRRDSPSPYRRRRGASPGPRRGPDSYVPNGRRSRGQDRPRHHRSRSRERRRSPSSSRSTSPPRRSRRVPSTDRSRSRSRTPVPRRSRRAPSPSRSRSPAKVSRHSPYRARSPRGRRGSKYADIYSPPRDRPSRRQHSRSVTPKEKSSSPSIRTAPPARRRGRESDSKSPSPAIMSRSVSPRVARSRKERRSRSPSSSRDGSIDSRADVHKKRKRGRSTSSSRSRSRSGHAKRRLSSTPSVSPPR